MFLSSGRPWEPVSGLREALGCCFWAPGCTGRLFLGCGGLWGTVSGLREALGDCFWALGASGRRVDAPNSARFPGAYGSLYAPPKVSQRPHEALSTDFMSRAENPKSFILLFAFCLCCVVLCFCILEAYLKLGSSLDSLSTLSSPFLISLCTQYSSVYMTRN